MACHFFKYSHGIAGVADSVISINWTAFQVIGVRRVCMLKSLLVEEPQPDVVIFGEGNFTFSVAFAALRQSWNGITSTRFEAVSPFVPEPQFPEVQLEAITYCIHNASKAFNFTKEVELEAKARTLDRVAEVLQLPYPRTWPTQTWRFGVDATNIPQGLDVGGKVVWFQCPWVPRTRCNQTTFKLISSFLTCMAGRQGAGDYVMIGIVTLFQYVIEYKLKSLLQHADKVKYKFVGADEELIKDILERGYHHKAVVGDIHDKIFNHHLTLVFRKRST